EKATFVSILSIVLGLAVPLAVAGPARADTSTQFQIGGVAAVVVDDAHQHVFVSGGIAQSMIAVFSFAGSLVTTLTGLPGPTGMTIASGSLYVTETDGAAIDVFDTSTLTKTKSIDISPYTHPHSVALAGGKLWFSYWQDGQFGGGVGWVDLSNISTPQVWDHDNTNTALYQPDLVQTSANTLILWSNGEEPTPMYKLDVSSGSVVEQSQQNIATGVVISQVTPEVGGTKLLASPAYDPSLGAIEINVS